MSFVQSTNSSSKNATKIACVCESRGQVPQIGIVAIDVSSCYVQLSEFADSKTYDLLISRLMVVDPHIILFPNTHLNSHLMATLDEHTGANLIPLDRKYFNDDNGMTILESYALLKDITAIKTLLTTQYFSLSAISALFHYLNNFIDKFALHSIKFDFCTAENTMLIDYTTAKNLELVTNQLSHKQGSLFSTLNFTCTKMGARKLRTSLLQPSTDENVIEKTSHCISLLLQKPGILNSIKENLLQLCDVDKLILFLVKVPMTNNSRVKSLNQTINSCVEIKKTCHSLMALWRIDVEDCPCLEMLHESISEEEINQIYMEIDKVMADENVFENSLAGHIRKRIFAIKPEINDMLDVARQMYSESVNDVYELCQAYSVEFNLELSVAYDSKFGYKLLLVKESEHLLNDDFIERKRKGKKLSVTTLDLIKLNERISENISEINLTSEKVLQSLKDYLRDNIDIWYKVSSALAEIDFIYSLTTYSKVNPTVKPTLSDVLAIKQGHHPIRQGLGQSSVPNDTYASKESRLQIISGCNMSGKSTYTKQTALLIIMCHIGCYVPCEAMFFPLFDSILTRIGNDDDLKTNAGSFVSEMRSLAYIFEKVTDKSFVIIDELGRGTCHMDAIAISLAAIEKLHQSHSIVFMITHIEDLIEPLEQYPGLLQVHFEATIKNGVLDYSFQIKEGASRSKFYGIDLAKEVCLPDKVVIKAREIASTLYDQEQHLIKVDKSVAISKIKHVFYELIRNTLRNENDLTLKVLKDYQKQYLDALSTI